MKSIFETETKNELVQRLDELSPTSSAKWGKMDAGQMLWHCKYPLKIAIKNKKEGNGKLFMKLFKKSLYNDKPFKRSLPTAKFLIPTESKNFNNEKEQLIQLISETHALKERKKWNPHPIFGNFTHEQWGKLEYKHLDHHLKQFDV